MTLQGLQGAAAIDRALTLLLQIGRSECDRPLADYARELLLPLSTAHRLATALQKQDLLAKPARGMFVLGPAVQTLTQLSTSSARLARYSRLPLRHLAEAHGVTAHLGVWDGDMVHYLVKEPFQSTLLTREGGRLEGYCSAIGKVLLASLSEDARAAYIATGPFVALTGRTITDETVLGRCLQQASCRSYAVDEEEVAPGLNCVAVPVRGSDGQVVAAISASGLGLRLPPPPRLLADLRRNADLIAAVAPLL